MWTYDFESLRYISRVQLLGQMIILCFNFLRNFQIVSQSDCIIYIPNSKLCVWVVWRHTTTSSPTLVSISLVVYSHPSWYEVIPHYGLDFHWASYYVVLGHLSIFFGVMSTKILSPFEKKKVISLFIVEFFFLINFILFSNFT